MRKHIKNLFLSPGLMAGLSVMLAGQVVAQAQSYSVLHTFGGANGAYPRSSLVLSGHTLYGTASEGGTYGGLGGEAINGNGTVFKVNTDGTGFTNLYLFTAPNPLNGKNGDGSEPFAGLILSGNTLYGTTVLAGTNGEGTVFAIKTDGTGFNTLYDCTGGVNALYGLSGNMLYGAINGGVSEINTNGTNFMTIYGLGGVDGPGLTGLILSGSKLYGIVEMGGIGYGAVFAVNTNSTGYTNLYNFTDGNDGAYPTALILSGNTLFGVAKNGGPNGGGTVFTISTDGLGFTNLYSFSEPQSNSQALTNSDGFNPTGLILSGNTLYGTANAGGTNGYGTVFAVNTNGTGFVTLHHFTGTDGAGPWFGASPILSNNTLYGTTSGIVYNGSWDGLTLYGQETVFALSIGPIPVSIQTSSNTLVLNWGNPAFLLQAATNISGVYTNVPGANSPYTNTIIGSKKFFRLISN
jgi:uncharacterized repeat protein (TIGR03803 family)